VNIADQFQQVWLVLADNRLVSILEEVTKPLVPMVEVHDVTREQLSHALRERIAARPNK
jgi:hypothetical protein